jgi:hypothetical protein
MPDVNIAQLKDFLRRKLSDADFGEVLAILAGGAGEDEKTGLPLPGGAMDRNHLYAMDGGAHAGRIVSDREMALQECSTVVPRENLIACDSAASVFKTTLRHLGVSTEGLHPSAYPAMLRTAKRGGSPAHHIHNPRAAADFATRFPDAARIKGI